MTSTREPFPVVLYGRVSIAADPDSKSVKDQLAELREWADREGWPVVGEFRDDGISASRYANGKVRPGWRDTMDVIESGGVRGLLTWDFARASRDDKVTAALKAVCVERGVKLGYGGMLRDPRTADGGFYVGLDGLMAAKFSAELSDKRRRAAVTSAKEGRPAGSLPYGYRRVINPETGKTVGRELHPEQAPIVAEIARRLLAREPADRIAKDLNDRNVRTHTGKDWRGGNLRVLAVRPTYAALRVHHGKVLDGVKATWPPIITEAQHHALVEMFADPERDKFRNSTNVKHLGAGLFRCGRDECDGRMRVVAQSGRRHAAYSCRVCHKVSRRQSLVDGLVTLIAVARLADDDAIAALSGDDGGTARQEAAQEAARLRAKVAAAREAWADDRLSLESFSAMEAATLPKIADAERRARPRELPAAVAELAGPDAADRWYRAPIETRRAALDALMTVTLLPAVRPGAPFDPELVAIAWKG